MQRELRVLGRLRLSRSSDESTSIERQREVVEQWAESNGHNMIGWAEDSDVSGSVDPFDTPALGDWLAHRADEFDVIVVWKLDRFGRNAIRLNRLFGWAQDHGKTIVSCSEGIDLSTPVGRLIANVIAFLAEGELEAIRERQRSSRAKLRQLARWHGGRPPFGYRVVENPGGPGRVLEVDDDTATVVRRVADAALAEYPLTRVAQELTDEGVATPANRHRGLPGGSWSATSLRQMLQSKALLGYVHQTIHSPACSTHWDKWCRKNCTRSETVRDDEGRPVQMAEPLVSVEEFDQIQRRLERIKESRANVKRKEPSPLSGVAICVDCGSHMHHDITRVGKYTYRTYRCRPCSVRVKADFLEAEVGKLFLAQAGDVEVQERVWLPGDSREAELREAVAAFDELTKAAGRMSSATASQRLQRQLDALDARIAELESAPAREARWEYRPTGQTYGEVWESSGVDQRRDLLIRSDVAATVSRLGVALSFPPEIAALLGGQDVPHGLPVTREVVVPEPDAEVERRVRAATSR